MTTSNETQQEQGDVFEAVWGFFSSVKLALILIIVLAVASFVGALIVQAPGGLANDPANYKAWLEQSMRPKYGSMTDLFDALKLFDVYNSLWFRLIMALLAFNVIICTLNRWPALWSSVFSPRVRMNEAFYTHAPSAVRLKGANVAVDQVKAVLSRRRYKVHRQAGDGATYLHGDKNGIAKLGTLATHVSLVLFLAGAVLGSVMGYSDDNVTIAEGQTYEFNRDGLNFQVRNDKFTVEFYPTGAPKDYRSDLVVIENGQEVARQTIHVNEPLIYKDIRFHQSFYGSMATIEVKDSTGKSIYNGPIRLNPAGPIYEGWILLPGNTRELGAQLTIGKDQGLNFQIWNLTNSASPAGPTGFVNKGQTGTVGDLQVTVNGVGYYTGLRMVKDPGANIVWIASILMILGVCMTFYFPRRRIWARVSGNEVALAGNADRFVNFKDEMNTIVDEVRLAVPGLEIEVAAAPAAPARRLRERVVPKQRR